MRAQLPLQFREARGGSVSELTISQVKDAKRELEQQIARLLEEFIDKTDIKIVDIDLSNQMTRDDKVVRYFVTVEVDL